MIDLFNDGYPEAEAATLIGLSRQTLRNWRVGYTTKSGNRVEPVLIEGKHWWKRRKTPRAPVIIDGAWVEKQLEIKRIKESI